MFYYIIGFLILIIARLLVNIKYSNKRIDTSFLHEAGCVLMGMYMIFVFKYLSVNILSGLTGIIISIVLFIPLGIFLPLLFARYRSFPIVVFVSTVVGAFTCLFQWILNSSTNLVNIVYLVIGAIAGFLFFMLNSTLFPSLKRLFVIRKRKRTRLTAFLILEADFVIFLVIMIFLIGNGTYRVLAQTTKEPSVKLDELKDDDIYGDIYYAEKDNYERYDEYAKKNPDMDIEDVVWRVEANLDKDFYSEVNEYDASEKNPLLLNKYNRVSDDFVPENLVTVYDSFLLTPDARDAFLAMQADMQELGYPLYIVSSYRSVTYQKGLFETFSNRDGVKEAERYSARGGFSEHCTGRAIDVSNNPSDLDVFAASEEGKWAYENAYKYGLILRYPEGCEDITGYIYESWHFSYVGKEISYKMHDENIKTLEEYVVKYVEHQE